MLATFQAPDRGGFHQERQAISREDALKRAQELFEKKGRCRRRRGSIATQVGRVHRGTEDHIVVACHRTFFHPFNSNWGMISNDNIFFESTADRS